MTKKIINFVFIFLLVLMVLTKGANCQCPTGYTLISGECFKAYNTEEKTWQEAEDFCELDGGHLAHVVNCTILGELSAYLRINQLTPSTTGYWIGASDSETEGTWLWTNRFEVEMGVPFWDVEKEWVLQPDGGTAENCAQVKPVMYYISDEACTDLANPLCQIEIVGNKEEKAESEKLELSCPSGFELIHNSCFSFHVDTVINSWSEAREFCQNRSADLSVIKDCTLFTELVQVIFEKYNLENGGYYIGSTDLGVEGWWTWIDFSYVDFGAPFWANLYQEPSGDTEQNCGFMTKKMFYYFQDWSCDTTAETRHVFCQIQPTAT